MSVEVAQMDAVGRLGVAIKRIERVKATFGLLSKALCEADGPSLTIQRHDPSWEAWKNLCDAVAALDG